MSYLLRNKPKFENKNKIIAVVILFIFLSLFGFLFPGFTRRLFLSIARPIWSISSITVKPFNGIQGFFVSKNTLIKNNLSLEEELKNFRLKEIEYELISKENEDLKLQISRNKNTERIISRILSKPPASPYDTLVVDVGSLHNVSNLSRVYSGENIIIGKILEVAGETSIVELFSSGNKKQESTLLRTGDSFNLVGRGGANFELEVPKDTDILWGDVFIYPKSSSVMGSVYYIDTSSKGSFKTVYIRVPGNVFSNQWVYIESQ